MNKFPIILTLMVSLVLTLGCAKSDWIQQTLVTVDVTGTWAGSNSRGVMAFQSRLELEQQGSKVIGTVHVVDAASQMGGAGSGQIEGSVAGDVFRFKQTNGPVAGEMTVSGDEMTGYMEVGSRIPLSFQRVGSSPRPRSQ